jgi:hypothetical protein
MAVKMQQLRSSRKLRHINERADPEGYIGKRHGIKTITLPM